MANAVRTPGRAPIGNRAPAKNQGRIATAGVAPTYSSCFGIRLASVSATPIHEGGEEHYGTDERKQTGGAELEIVAVGAAPRRSALPPEASRGLGRRSGCRAPAGSEGLAPRAAPAGLRLNRDRRSRSVRRRSSSAAQASPRCQPRRTWRSRRWQPSPPSADLQRRCDRRGRRRSESEGDDDLTRGAGGELEAAALRPTSREGGSGREHGGFSAIRFEGMGEAAATKPAAGQSQIDVVEAWSCGC